MLFRQKYRKPTEWMQQLVMRPSLIIIQCRPEKAFIADVAFIGVCVPRARVRECVDGVWAIIHLIIRLVCDLGDSSIPPDRSVYIGYIPFFVFRNAYEKLFNCTYTDLARHRITSTYASGKERRDLSIN